MTIFKNTYSALSYLIFFSCFALSCSFLNFGFAQNIHISENTFVTNLNLIHEEPQSQNKVIQNQRSIYVFDKTIVFGLNHFEEQILDTATSKQAQFAIYKIRNLVFTKNATQPYLFSKTPLNSKNTCQAFEVVATILIEKSISQLKKKLLKSHFTSHVLKIDSENSLTALYDTAFNEQHNSYSLLVYFPPPESPTAY